KNKFCFHGDIEKYFPSVNHGILKNILRQKIEDGDLLWLLDTIIDSAKQIPGSNQQGMPIGNLTSQLFANIYLDELDKFVKQDLKIKYYIRYCDDFIILDANEANLKSLICKIDNFLQDKLKLSLHPNKVEIRKYRQGIDFLGYVSFPYHRILRVKTKNRIIRKLGDIGSPTFSRQTIQSYLGVLKHCDSYKLKKEILDLIEHRA
ncbi:MAG: RNA-directed DNA polymerase, partial [Candidatus Staskawiczbacteria bacterium]|nr:RNA-directed DNA polymerase [Candidatus Staskawiczbacteria bacterium]